MQDRNSYLVQLLVENWAASFAKQGGSYSAFAEALENVITEMQFREQTIMPLLRATFQSIAFRVVPEWHGPVSTELEAELDKLLVEEVPE